MVAASEVEKVFSVLVNWQLFGGSGNKIGFVLNCSL